MRTVKARELYARMMRTLAQTGNGWMTFKDASNMKCNQTGKKGNVVHLSNLCTEILEVTSNDETAVCNLGSINLGKHLIERDGVKAFDFEGLGKVRTAVVPRPRHRHQLLPHPRGRGLELPLAPGGAGPYGPAGRLLPLRLAFDSPEALDLDAHPGARITRSDLREPCQEGRVPRLRRDPQPGRPAA